MRDVGSLFLCSENSVSRLSSTTRTLSEFTTWLHPSLQLRTSDSGRFTSSWSAEYTTSKSTSTTGLSWVSGKSSSLRRRCSRPSAISTRVTSATETSSSKTCWLTTESRSKSLISGCQRRSIQASLTILWVLELCTTKLQSCWFNRVTTVFQSTCGPSGFWSTNSSSVILRLKQITACSSSCRSLNTAAETDFKRTNSLKKFYEKTIVALLCSSLMIMGLI